MDANARMPGDAEARGAVAAMAETYGVDLPAVGDYVRGITCGRHWAGRVVTVDERRLVVDLDGATLEAHPTDLVR